MNKKSAFQILLFVGLAGFAVWNFLKPSDGRRIDLNPYQALGMVSGEEVSKLLQHQGRIVLVTPDPGDSADPVLDAQVAAFRKGLAAAGKAKIESTATIKMDGFTAMRMGGAVPPEALKDLFAKHQGAAALVFFIGLPPVDVETMGPSVTGKTKVVVVSAPFAWYPGLVKQGLLHLAIVSRANAPAESPNPGGGLRATFDREYEILRAPASDSSSK